MERLCRGKGAEKATGNPPEAGNRREDAGEPDFPGAKENPGTRFPEEKAGNAGEPAFCKKPDSPAPPPAKTLIWLAVALMLLRGMK